MSPPPHKSPPPIHCHDKLGPLRGAGTRVMRQGQGSCRDTACEHHLGLVFSARGYRQENLAQGTAPHGHHCCWYIPPVQGQPHRSPLCTPSQGHHVLKPPMPAASRAVPTLPLGAWGTCTHRTSTLPEYTLLTLMHTTHMVHVTHGGQTLVCVGACRGTGRAGRHPCNSSH